MLNYKKTLLLLLLIVFTATTFGQLNQYSKGFEKGFKEGYCYNDGVTCVPPSTPLTPLPKLGETYGDYQAGYNRGFQIGLDLYRLQKGKSAIVINSQSYSQKIPDYTPSEYVPPVDLDLLRTVIERKQRTYNTRTDWIQERLDKIGDLATTLLKDYAPDEYVRISNSYHKFINEQLNGQALDLTNNSLFNQIVGILNKFEEDIYDSYKKGTSELNTVLIPNRYSFNYANTKCEFKSVNGKIQFYLVTDKLKKKVSVSQQVTFSLITEDFKELPSIKIYYMYSLADNSYFYTVQKKVEGTSAKLETMKYIFSAKAFIMFSNPARDFWLFDEGRSQTGNLVDLGYKSCKKENGTIGIFQVYQNSGTNKKYYIPRDTFKNGVLNLEYPIYVK
ncbi:MAG: hypothetical protein QM652_13980 [Legionella sp.]|uniref:hypothetical protein n=1 Tax=Legionella sp. TaxID=459 RepID=UPI0039E505A3